MSLQTSHLDACAAAADRSTRASDLRDLVGKLVSAGSIQLPNLGVHPALIGRRVTRG